MFQAQDIHDILQSLPPQEYGSGPSSSALPPLLISPPGEGFVATSHARREFEKIVSDAESRLSSTDIAKDLAIETDAVLRFAELSSPDLVLLGRDQSIIPRSHVTSLEQTLRKQLAQQLLSKDVFCAENNLSPNSLDALLRSMQGDEHLGGGLTSFQDHIASKTYCHVLSHALRSRLEDASKQARSAEFTSEALPGSPPTWYVSQILQSTIVEGNFHSKFHVSEESGVVRCTPEESIAQQRDATISQLQTGHVPYLDVQELFHKFREIYSSTEQLEELLKATPDIHLLGRTAVSLPWLKTFADGCCDAVKVLGYANLTSRIEDTFPSECHAFLFDKLEQHIQDSLPQDANKLHKVEGFLLSPSRYDSDQSLLVHSAAAHATHHWQNLKGDPQKELKFQINDIFNFIPEEQAILRALSEDSNIRRRVEDAYWSEISRLESENEADFEKFWSERVVSRVANYTRGIEGLDDAKLAEQLSQLLATYLKKELTPDMIAKARSKDLLRSRKTKKNVQKLESALQRLSSAPDLSSVLSALEKFRQKQGLQVSEDADSLERTKNILVTDLIRRMQKTSDSPTLFLLTVIVLLAKEKDGVVYATGKYAPKLMKLLRPTLGDDYTLLEGWKDKAKSGALDAEDIERMKKMARDVSEPANSST